MVEMQIKTKNPVDHMELWGEREPTADDVAFINGVEPGTVCLIVGDPCCCWDDGECKNPGGRCDGE